MTPSLTKRLSEIEKSAKAVSSLYAGAAPVKYLCDNTTLLLAIVTEAVGALDKVIASEEMGGKFPEDDHGHLATAREEARDALTRIDELCGGAE